MIGGKYSLLYLDDCPAAIQYLRVMLEAHADLIVSEFFGNPDLAIAAHRKHQFDIVISDLRLGPTTGLEVIAQMRSFAPNSAYVMVSGDADLESALAAVNAAKALRFLVKPCTKEHLAAALNDCVQHLGQHHRLNQASISARALRETKTAIVSFDEHFNISFLNESAQYILHNNDIFGLTAANSLVSTGSLSTLELKDKMRQSVHSVEKRGLPFACFSKDYENKLILYPLHGDETDQTPGEYAFIIIDPANTRILTSEQLAEILSLSMSEARVVKNLALGLSVDETANACNLSLSTVRTYLKNACAKVGVSRQAEIVALALRSAI